MRLLLPLLASLIATPLHAACLAPDGIVEIPDGTIATREEMVTAKKAVQALDTAVKAYSACLDQEEDEAIQEGGDKIKLTEQYAKRTNAAVDRLQKVVDKFNIELRAYKAKNPA